MTENDLIATHQTWAEPCDARLITPSDEAYERGQRVWNGMIDRRPAGVLRCTSANDVRAGLSLARAAGYHGRDDCDEYHHRAHGDSVRS
jgi:hypothetical protein